MKIKKNTLIWSVVGIAVITLIILLAVISYNRPGKLDAFAKCLTDSGAKFYGAFWCSHCQTQKLEFDKSVEFIPYVECSTADGRGQLEVCAKENITGYPTWVFPDGSRLSGEVPMQTLADKTLCMLPKQ